MRKRGLLLTFALLIAIQIFGQEIKNNASVRSCMFLTNDSAYVETSMLIAGNSIRYAEQKPRGFQGTVEVEVLITDGTTILNFDKYLLSTPVIYDTNKIDFSLIDQKRLLIPNKTVSVETKFTDLNDPSNVYIATESLTPIITDAVQVSDIQFIESFKASTKENSFTKNGFEMKPYPLNFFPSTHQNITFYGEVYQTDKYVAGEQFMITYSIRSSSTDKMNNLFYHYAKMDASPVVPFLKQMDITDLPGGNYNLIIEIRNSKNELLTIKRVFFQRANEGPINAWENIQMINTGGTFVDAYTEEELNYFLDILYPIASVSDARLIESLSDRVEPEMKRKFLYNFWVERNPENPEKAWTDYQYQVKIVNQNYSTPSRQGYKTDRGRVYLQYGPPSDIVTSVNEPGAYPYEIWFYATLPDKQTNIGFAFYEPAMASNDFILLHSNARSELQDPRWKVKLYENVASQDELMDYDITEVEDKVQMLRAIDMYDF